MRRIAMTNNGLKAEFHKIIKDDIRNHQMTSKCYVYKMSKDNMEEYLSKYENKSNTTNKNVKNNIKREVIKMRGILKSAKTNSGVDFYITDIKDLNLSSKLNGMLMDNIEIKVKESNDNGRVLFQANGELLLQKTKRNGLFGSSVITYDFFVGEKNLSEFMRRNIGNEVSIDIYDVGSNRDKYMDESIRCGDQLVSEVKTS